jgi:phytoene dehydrogenase-like protein
MKFEMPIGITFSTIYPTLRILRMFYKYRNPVANLASKFKNPVLRELFLMVFDWGPMCAAFPLWTLALMAQGNGGYPIGGSLAFIGSIEKRFRDLGGEIHFNSRITRILTENDTATGIELEDGSTIKADVIISAADGYNTIYKLLDGKYTGKKITHAYQSLKLFPPLVFVSLGIDANFSQEPHSITFSLKTPFRIGPDEIKLLFIKNYSFDPTLAPERKCVLTLMIPTDYEYWEGLKDNRERYLAEKTRIGKEVINGLSQVYPGIMDKIEVMDIATPLTFVRYTGNYKGSYEGWMLDKKALIQQIPMTLPGLNSFYMAGQWISPGGGLPSGLITGRNAIRKICKSEKKKFVSFV